MIIHIIQDSVYANDFIRFLGTYYCKEDHFVYVIERKEHHVEENGNNCPWQYFHNKDIFAFNRKARKADKVIIHGLFDTILFIWLFFHLFNMRKIVISIWGGDLYIHKKLKEDPDTTLRSKMFDFVRGMIFKGTPLFLNDMAEDYDLLKEWYHVRGRSIHIIYPASVDMEFLERAITEKHNNQDKVVILLGNSATESNMHIEAFNLLKKFENENIEIYCPLSYGDINYREKVIQTGKEIFGNKFIAVVDFMKPEEYCKLLASVDVAVFNNDRQQAMGNIAMLAYLGSKVYLRNDTTMWEQYVKKGQCGFHCVLDIDKITFEEFSYNSNEDQIKNKKYFSRLWDVEYLKDMWDKAFEKNI